MKKKYYFKEEDSELCYSKSYFEKKMQQNHISEMEVFEAIPEVIGGGIFWCKEHMFCGDDTKES